MGVKSQIGKVSQAIVVLFVAGDELWLQISQSGRGDGSVKTVLLRCSVRGTTLLACHVSSPSCSSGVEAVLEVSRNKRRTLKRPLRLVGLSWEPGTPRETQVQSNLHFEFLRKTGALQSKVFFIKSKSNSKQIFYDGSFDLYLVSAGFRYISSPAF